MSVIRLISTCRERAGVPAPPTVEPRGGNTQRSALDNVFTNTETQFE